MKTLDMHSIIFQICKSNQIKRNYKRTSATMATKQVCWPHSHKPQKDSCQTSLNWNTGHLAETPVEIKRVFSSPLLIFALPFPVCCLKMPFSAMLLSLPADRSSARLEGPCQATQAAMLCPFPSNTAPEALQPRSEQQSLLDVCGTKDTKTPHQKTHLKLPGQLSMGAPWSTKLLFDIFILLFWIFGLLLTNSWGKKSNLFGSFFLILFLNL